MEAFGEVKDDIAIDLGSLLDAGEGAVVVLVAGDTRLVAHRAVLSARSPVFQRILQDAATGEVAIPDVEGPVLRQLLVYLYTLQAPQLPGMAPQLLAAAEQYGLPALKADCEQQVAKQLSVETAAATALLAVRHSCSILRKAAIAYMKTHVFEVMVTQGWADAVRMQHEGVVELSQLLSETSSPALGEGGTSPATQPHSDQGDGSRNPASAAPPMDASRQTLPPYGAAVSRLRSLSPEEKGRRLIEAAKVGAVEELEALLAAGADVGTRGRDTWTALHWAARRGHVEAARRLVVAGAAVDARGSWEQTPLHWAADSGHAAVVRLLLAAGADHSARSVGANTPLHRAAFNGHRQAAAALLEAGADRGARNSWGHTPLSEARWNNDQQLDDLLQGR